MKLLTFEADGRPQAGVVQDSEVVPVRALLGGRAASVHEIVAEGLTGRLAAGLSTATERLSLDGLTLLPPIPDPGKILCVGANYEDHRIEAKRDKSAFPTLFSRFPESLVGAGAPLDLPPESGQLDFEGEIAVVIGRNARRVTPSEALGCVWGYACFNDASLRDWQRHTHQWLPGKNFDGTGAFGPWLVTADEVAEPDALALTTRLNGVVVQQARAAQMIFSIADIIAYASRFTTLRAGDVIVTGTPGGVGMARTPPLYMVAGDRVEVEVTGLGTLANTVRAVAADPVQPQQAERAS